MFGVIEPLHTRQYGHRIGGGSFHSVVCRSRINEKVVTGPGEVVPGHQAVEVAGGKIVAILLISGDRGCACPKYYQFARLPHRIGIGIGIYTGAYESGILMALQLEIPSVPTVEAWP